MALAVGIAILILILIFILQNLAHVRVSFLDFSATLPLGVALLIAAVAGCLIALAVGSARILQLRMRGKGPFAGSAAAPVSAGAAHIEASGRRPPPDRKDG